MQHRDCEKLFKKKWLNAQMIQNKIRHFVDYKRHQEAADVLERAISKAKTIGGVND